MKEIETWFVDGFETKALFVVLTRRFEFDVGDGLFLVDDFVLGDLEEGPFGVLDEHLGDRLDVLRDVDGRHRATAQTTAHRQSEHEVLNVLLVRVGGEVE